MKKYWLVWKATTLLSLQSSLENRFAAILFTAGKLLRFGLFLGFLYVLTEETKTIGDFTQQQLIVFFLVFNVFDLVGQLLFRGIYRFREQVISGEFDFILVKPLNQLFQVMTRYTDVLDLPLLVLVLGMLFQQPMELTGGQMLAAVAVSLGALLVIGAIHILVAALGVFTTEVDHTIMIYRDLSQMARFPIDIYVGLVRALLTFVLPIALAFTLPAKALLGLLDLSLVPVVLLASGLVFYCSLKLWSYALTMYSSASS